MRRKFRRQIRRSRQSPAKQHVLGYGFRVGYWPCLQGPYLQIAFHSWIVDLWYGIASLKQVEAGDR